MHFSKASSSFFKHIRFDLARAPFFSHSLCVEHAHRKCVLALHQRNRDGNAHLHPPGAWSYELLLSRSRKMGSWKEQGDGRGLLLLTPGMPACRASLHAESVHRDAACRDAIDRDAIDRDAVRRHAVHRDAVSPHPYAAGVSALPRPVHLVGQPCQSARQHMLYQVSTCHNLSFSRASGKAGGRQWLFALLCWASQHIPQAAQRALWARDQQGIREHKSKVSEKTEISIQLF